jgi:preprotein translocase subunit YajC
MSPLLHAFVSQTADAPAAANPLSSFLVPVAFMALAFYFVMYRPQAKQAKEHQKFLTELKKGDEVLTQGGVIGVVFSVDDRTVTLDVGGGTKLRVVKQQVAGPWKQAEAQAPKAEARK